MAILLLAGCIGAPSTDAPAQDAPEVTENAADAGAESVAVVSFVGAVVAHVRVTGSDAVVAVRMSGDYSSSEDEGFGAVARVYGDGVTAMMWGGGGTAPQGLVARGRFSETVALPRDATGSMFFERSLGWPEAENMPLLIIVAGGFHGRGAEGILWINGTGVELVEPPVTGSATVLGPLDFSCEQSVSGYAALVGATATYRCDTSWNVTGDIFALGSHAPNGLARAEAIELQLSNENESWSGFYAGEQRTRARVGDPQIESDWAFLSPAKEWALSIDGRVAGGGITDVVLVADLPRLETWPVNATLRVL